MLVEAIQASLRDEEQAASQAGEPRGAAGAGAAPGLGSEPGSLRPDDAQPPAPGAGAAAVARAHPGPGFDPKPDPIPRGVNPGRRRSSGGLLGLFRPRGSSNKRNTQGGAAEGPAPNASVPGPTPGPVAAPDAAAPDPAAQPLPAEQNAAREMLHAPTERDSGVGSGCLGSAPDTVGRAGDSHSAPDEHALTEGQNPAHDPNPPSPLAEQPQAAAEALADMRARAAAARAARAWQPPFGLAELEAALPAGGNAQSAAGTERGAAGAAAAGPTGEIGRRRPGSERVDASESMLGAAEDRRDPGCGGCAKGGGAVPIIAAAGSGGSTPRSDSAASRTVKPPPQTPRGAVDYSALATGRWEEG